MGSYIHFFLFSQNIVRNQLSVNVRNRRANLKVQLSGVLNKSRSKAALVTPEEYVSLYIPHKKTSLGDSLAEGHAYNPIRDSGAKISPRVAPRVSERVSARLLAYRVHVNRMYHYIPSEK